MGAVTDDEVIRKRLLIDGDGAGDDRRINLLVKSFIKWCNSGSGRAAGEGRPRRAGPRCGGGGRSWRRLLLLLLPPPPPPPPPAGRCPFLRHVAARFLLQDGLWPLAAPVASLGREDVAAAKA